MMQEKKRLWFKTARIIHDDRLFEKLLSEKKFAAITAISYSELEFAKNLPVKKKSTLYIPLKADLEDILEKFQERSRRYVKSSLKNLEFKFAVDDKNFSAIYEMYKNFERSKSRKPLGKDSFRVCIFFSAYHNGVLISVIAVYLNKPFLRARAIFSKRLETDDAKLKNIIGAATKTLVYVICRYGKENGYESFDLGSLNFENPQTKNISAFKMSFGGEVVPEYTYKYKSGLFAFFEKFARLKSKFSIF